MSNEAAESGMYPITRISRTTLAKVHQALREYCAVVERSGLRPSSQATYIDMASNFVRWMHGDFNPGSRNAEYVDRKKQDAA